MWHFVNMSNSHLDVIVCHCRLLFPTQMQAIDHLCHFQLNCFFFSIFNIWQSLSIRSDLLPICRWQTSWHCPCYIEYLYCIHVHDVSLVFVHSCVDMWSTKTGNQIVYLYFTNVPCIYKALTLNSHWFAYTKVYYYWLSLLKRFIYPFMKIKAM